MSAGRVFAVMLSWPREAGLTPIYQGYAVVADGREQAITKVEAHFSGQTFAVTGAAQMKPATAERLALTLDEVWPL